MAQHVFDGDGRAVRFSNPLSPLAQRLRERRAISGRVRRSERAVSLLAAEEYTGHAPGGAFAELGFRPPEPPRQGAPFADLGFTAPVEGLEGVTRHHDEHPHAVAS